MTSPTEKAVYEYEPWGKFLVRMAKGIFRIACWVVGLAIAIALLLNGYDQLDVNGYISHDVTVDLYMSNDWIVGENRLCTLTEFPDEKGRPNGHPLGVTCRVKTKGLTLTTCR